MRRQTPVASLLYSRLFPTAGPADPCNFQTHLTRNLVPEIRIETARFYGSLDSIEARYPGLDYCHAPHRMRLGRFPHHARLFQAIDDLGITDQEVADLARWEGTLWARQRFERDEAIKVRDTTGDGIGPWVDPRTAKRQHERGIRVKVETAVKITQQSLLHDLYECIAASRSQDSRHDQYYGSEEEDEDDDDDDDDDEDHDNDLDDEDHGNNTTHHHQRPISAAYVPSYAPSQPTSSMDTTTDMNPDLEAYLKELAEHNHLLTASRPADGPLPSSGPTAAGMPTTGSTFGQPTA